MALARGSGRTGVVVDAVKPRVRVKGGRGGEGKALSGDRGEAGGEGNMGKTGWQENNKGFSALCARTLPGASGRDIVKTPKNLQEIKMGGTCKTKHKERGAWFEIQCVKNDIIAKEADGEGASFEIDLLRAWAKVEGWSAARKALDSLGK